MMSNNIQAMYIIWNYLGKMPTPHAAHHRALDLFEIPTDELTKGIKYPFFPRLRLQLHPFFPEHAIHKTGLTYWIDQKRFHVTFEAIKKEFQAYIDETFLDDIITDLEPIWIREKGEERKRQAENEQRIAALIEAQKASADSESSIQSPREENQISIPFDPQTENQKAKSQALRDLLQIFTDQHETQKGMKNKHKCFSWFLLIYYASIDLDYSDENILVNDLKRTWSNKFEDLWAALMKNKWNGSGSGNSKRSRTDDTNYEKRAEFEADIKRIEWNVNDPKFESHTNHHKKQKR